LSRPGLDRRALCLGGGALALPLRAAPARLRLPQRDPDRQESWHYLRAVLALALERCGRSDEIEESDQHRVQTRAIRELLSPGGQLDLIWAGTDAERERLLLPIRIPLDFGLLGHRLALVREVDRDRWRDVHTLAELKTSVAGQGHDWPDTQILRSNSLKVDTSSRSETLFDMLRRGRIDWFPRSVIEIDAELATALARGLVIEPHLLLHYPAAAYLFVRPDRPELAQDLTRGLEAAVADGSLMRLFMAHHGALIERHRLQQRRLLKLQNPLLPPLTPLKRKELWLDFS
jgi:membrane-bound lytic murein transglycosylase MltF